MAKTYINTVKYMIRAKFDISGIVDKHDIVGAIFGQSEGLLGKELDLRELQKNGRIGRIEITTDNQLGKTVGEVIVPSSMDMVETSILAAAIESVDKVGPCDAKFDTQAIEDTREQKRKEITERAKELLQRLNSAVPESQVLTEEVRDKVRVAELIEYGLDKLPAGPSIDSSESIIIVEGRADVLNLLKNNIDNVVGMDGSKISQTLIDLTRKKETIAFIDGDRGGLLNLRKLQQLAKVDFVCQAPDGKEVEELTRKEIIGALRKRIPIDEFGKNEFHSDSDSSFSKPYTPRTYAPRTYNRSEGSFRERSDRRSSSGRFGKREYARSDSRFGDRRSTGSFDRRSSDSSFKKFDRSPRFSSYSRESFGEQTQFPAIEPKASIEDIALFSPTMNELKNSLKAKLFNEQMQLIEEIEVKDLIQSMTLEKAINSIVFDGIITQRLVDAAEKAGVKTLVGIRKGKIEANQNVKTVIIE